MQTTRMTTGMSAKLSHDDWLNLKRAVAQAKINNLEYQQAQQFLMGLGIDYPNSWSRALSRSGREIRRVDRYGFE